ncbi:MAG: hypothetical protein PHQ35_02755 [Phycisphaerae bacterium]|nr:hypothetical protein [Phycisphaerae bacterium]MDD5380787.1 hypothetical protein [Phycisphaerae bacterium]
MANNARCFLAVLSIAMICSVNCPAREDGGDYTIVEPNEIPGILSIIASSIQGNFEKIKTWQGWITDVSVTSVRGELAGELLKKASKDVDPNNLPDEIQVIHNSRTEYKINVANNHFSSLSDRTEPPAYLDPKNSKIYPLDWGPGERIFLITSDYKTEITAASWGTKDKVISSRMAVKEPPGGVHKLDPRKVFYFGEKTFWRALRNILQNIQTPDIEHYGVVIKKRVAGDNTTYRLEISDSGKKLLSTHIFSSEMGFNQTYFETYFDDGSLRSKKTIEFTKVQNVFLPKKWEGAVYFRDGGLDWQEDCTIENQQINMPIPDNTFSELTYLNSGDKVRDKITNKDFEYKNGALVELVKKPSPK